MNQRNWLLASSYNFQISFALQPDGEHHWNFKLWLLDIEKFLK